MYNASFFGGGKQGIRCGGILRGYGVRGIKKEGEWRKKRAMDFTKNGAVFLYFVVSFWLGLQ